MVNQRCEVAPRLKVTFSLDEQTVQELAELSEKRQSPKSRVVEDALRLLVRAQIAEELRRGYEAMAENDRETAEANLPAAAEVLE
jgi:predicted transcriptional regulator